MRSRLASCPTAADGGEAPLYDWPDPDRPAGDSDQGARPAGSPTWRRCCSPSRGEPPRVHSRPPALTGETTTESTWGIDAAKLVALGDARASLLTFGFTHFEGIRWNGARRVLQELDYRMAPKGPRCDRAARGLVSVHAADLD